MSISTDFTRSSIQSILAAYDTANLRRSLATYPARIKAQRDACNQARRALKDAEIAKAEAEAELLLTISAATDAKGKARYSNAEQRAAALTRDKGHDPGYLDAASAVMTAEADLNEAQDALQMLLDEYQSARIAARLIAAEMSVLSELIDTGDASEVSAGDAVRMEIPFDNGGNGDKRPYKEAF